MHTMKWLRRLSAVAALTLVASACGGGGGGGGGQTAGGGDSSPQAGGQGGGDGVLKLGYVLPETGQLAFLGPPQIQAAGLAVQEINQAGGVLGKRIPAMVSGDEGDQQSVAVQSAQRVLNQNVDGLIGAAASGQSLAIIDMITGAGVVQCSGSNTSPTFTDYQDNGFYFRTAPSDAMQGPVLADLIISDGHANVAILARADDYGRGLANATAQALQEAGATVAVNETYDPLAQNFDAPVQSVTNANPDAVVVIAFEEGAQIMRGLIEGGLSADTFYGADGLRSEELPETVNPNDPGVLAGMQGTAPASAGNQQFLSQLKQFAPNLKEVQFAPQVYDCVNIIALAAEAAGSDAPAKIKQEVVGVTKGGTQCSSFEECKQLLGDNQDIDYQGQSGPLDFIDAGEPGKASIEVYSFNQQGDLTSVRTVEATL